MAAYPVPRHEPVAPQPVSQIWQGLEPTEPVAVGVSKLMLLGVGASIVLALVFIG